jgi:hypothetical protein
LTQREEDKRVRRGKVAAKGATVIFWRLAGGKEDELFAPRDLLFDLEAMCGAGDRCPCPGHILDMSLAPEIFMKLNYSPRHAMAE